MSTDDILKMFDEMSLNDARSTAQDLLYELDRRGFVCLPVMEEDKEPLPVVTVTPGTSLVQVVQDILDERFSSVPHDFRQESAQAIAMAVALRR